MDIGRKMGPGGRSHRATALHTFIRSRWGDSDSTGHGGARRIHSPTYCRAHARLPGHVVESDKLYRYKRLDAAVTSE